MQISAVASLEREKNYVSNFFLTDLGLSKIKLEILKSIFCLFNKLEKIFSFI